MSTIDEIEILRQMDSALGGLGDEGRNRVLNWLNAKFGNGDVHQKSRPISEAIPPKADALSLGREIPGIAKMKDNGDMVLTLRDPKAKNTNDAAIRLGLVAIRAYCSLNNVDDVSSRKVVKPILEKWRAYTGNTRRVLANHHGILREGDMLSLDQHAMNEADQYMQEMLDPSITGTWKPGRG